jgi:hypothetical protein
MMQPKLADKETCGEHIIARVECSSALLNHRTLRENLRAALA